jgi:hypothetical protein
MAIISKVNEQIAKTGDYLFKTKHFSLAHVADHVQAMGQGLCAKAHTAALWVL